MDENIQTTVQETGKNSTNDELITKATEILNAINAKNERNEKSIINDNVKQFSDEEGQILRELIQAQKNRAVEEAEKAQREKDDMIAKLQEEIGAYKDKERSNLLNNSLADIYEELGITQEGGQKQAYRLALSGVDTSAFFKEDGTVDKDKVKKAFEDVITDVPSLVDKKSSNVVIKETNHDDTDEAIKKRQEKIAKKWRLTDDKEQTTTPGGFKSKLL